MSTPPFIMLELMLGAVILAVAVVHLALASSGVRRRLNLTFALLAVFVASEALAAPLRYLSSSIPSLVVGLKLSQGCIVAYAVVLVWFTRQYAGFKHIWYPAFISALGCTVLGLHLALPYSLLFESVSALRTDALPGGGIQYIAVGPPHPWLYLGNLYGVLAIAYLTAGCIRLWRTPSLRGRALALTAGASPLVLFAYPHAAMVNRGLVDPPVYYTLGFLGLVMIMSHDILHDVVRSSRLSQEVRSNEQRWRSLLENVSLLVVGFDRSGRIDYINPHLLQTAGYEAQDLLGKQGDMLFPPPELPSVHQGFAEAMHGRMHVQAETGLLTRSGEERRILWSSVLLYGAQNEAAGILSVGADITDRVRAERTRDEALAQVTALKMQLEAENQYLKLEYEGTLEDTELIGKSDAIRYVLHKVKQVASTDATVLIEGETGVGKELVAKAIHNASRRSKMPFVRVNCAALPPSLVESELFGHERGAFTGADRMHQGRFELAEGGTLLLDEIGELSLDIQAKLLRVLQEGEFDRVGGSRTRKADVRVVASTNRQLAQEVASGRFREDLFYRLQVFPITVPPLRERREDIPLLIHHFVQKMCRRHGKPVLEVSMKLVEQLSNHEWPGNVRELENAIERAVLTSMGSKLTVPAANGIPASPPWSGQVLSPMTLDAVERRHIEEVLKQTKGQIAGAGGAAEILGLHPNTLRGRMAKLGVKRPADA